MDILQIENLSFRYPGSERNAIEQVSFSVRSGEFLVVCGESGCGKTTLLRLLKPELAPAGEMSGRVAFGAGERTAADIGFVLQNPDNQIVTDKVWHELAFGLENMGLPTELIRRRVGEMASYFGIQDWFRKRTDELSGGQKQLLNLAAVMVMQPKVLILDEPTSQLDPIAASDFLATLQKLNREFGLTVILAEHRLEDILPAADRVLLMDGGKILFCDVPERIGSALPEGHPMRAGLPSAVRIFQSLHIPDRCPLTVREGRDFLERHFIGRAVMLPEPEYRHADVVVAELKNVWFRYERDLPDVLRGTSVRIYKGELFVVLGGNGSGKTTMLQVMAGIGKAYRGRVLIEGKPIRAYRGNSLYHGVLALLPQNPQTVFIRDTVRADFDEILEAHGVQRQERNNRILGMAEKFGIAPLLDRNPFDLSGGEQQKCALAKVLLTEPRILLLDEPTKGMDAGAKQTLRAVLTRLKQEGITLLVVTHDVDFAAETADRCALFFDGEILSADTPSRFFSGNAFYTTAANRMARSLCPNAVTCGQVVEFCTGGSEN
jgi:energy-coupling factor transport system ATP-binding protein